MTPTGTCCFSMSLLLGVWATDELDRDGVVESIPPAASVTAALEAVSLDVLDKDDVPDFVFLFLTTLPGGDLEAVRREEAFGGEGEEVPVWSAICKTFINGEIASLVLFEWRGTRGGEIALPLLFEWRRTRGAKESRSKSSMSESVRFISVYRVGSFGGRWGCRLGIFV